MQPAQPTVEGRVGMRVPQTAQLYAVPETVEVPAIKTYRYMMVNNRIVLIDVLIDLATSEVVDGFADEGSGSLPVARCCTRLR